jgi:hypothetical protein
MLFRFFKINYTYVRVASLFIFIIGVLAFFGSSVYPDFYFQMKSKITGEFIDYSTLAEFCGWTGLALPGETEFDRGIRAFWNMLSAMLGVTALSLVVFVSFAGIIIGIVRIAGGFKETDSS